MSTNSLKMETADFNLRCYTDVQIHLHPNDFIICLPFARVLQRAPIFISSFHSLLSVELHISTAASNSSLLPSRKLTFYPGIFFPPKLVFVGKKMAASTKPIALHHNNTLTERRYICGILFCEVEDHALKHT